MVSHARNAGAVVQKYLFIYLLNLQKEEKGPGMSYIDVCTHWLKYEYP